MTPAETRCVMTQIVMPMHPSGVAGVMFGGIMMPWIDIRRHAAAAARRHDRLRAAGRTEHST
jgi:acyl-CoA hydrolase